MFVALLAATCFFLPTASNRARVTSEKKYVAPTTPRLTRTINRDWTFNYSPASEADLSLAAPTFDDARWPAIALPHTWSTYETTREKHPFIRHPSERDDPYWWHGWGWYRKHFFIGQEQAARKVFVEFDGVQKYAKVYLNGKLVGDHKGGYTSFSFDLTSFIRFGQDNVLAVQISNRRDDPFGGIPPMTAGNFNVYGGIYRDVRLVLKDPLHVPFQGAADHEGGTFVTTPEVDQAGGVVNVKTYVRNNHAQTRECLLVTTITDAAGIIQARMETKERIEPGALREFNQKSARIANPKLWSPAAPYLYQVFTEVRDGERITDTYQSPLGFRWFRWDHAENRFYLNDQPVRINGTNRHQEYPWLGDAMPKWLHERDLQAMRAELNHNFMRTAHYPQDPLVYDLADRLGIITVEEVPNIKNIDFSEEVQQQHVREMIRRDRNHPSIMFWSMGNETNDAADSEWAWAEDQTRIIHLRHAENGGGRVTHTHQNLDMENLLRVTVKGWYDRSVKAAEPADGQVASTEEWQHTQARVRGGSVRGMLGEDTVVWLYADHGADREYKHNPLKHVNSKGWVDAYRFPKYIYYLWQANYSERPMVFIHPHHWRAENTGQSKDFVVDSNCDEVELKVNGVSQGKLQPTAANFHTVTFKNIRVAAGTITVAGRRGQQLVSDSVVMAGAPARIRLTTSHNKISADRAGLAVVSADITDAKGVRVCGANPTLTWQIAGPGTLVGAEVYESDRDKHEAMEGAMYTDTPVSNIIRAQNVPGRIRVSVTAPGLPPAAVEIRSVAPSREAAAGIVEPILSDRNRLPVRRDLAFKANQPRVYSPEIAEISEHHRINGQISADFKSGIDKFISARNPGVPRQSVAYGLLTDRLARTLLNSNGHLVADDYNFIIKNYHDARRLISYLETTTLHPLYRAAMSAAYASEAITRGVQLDYAAEQQRLAAIGNNAKLALIEATPHHAHSPRVAYDTVRDVFRVQASNLEQLVTLLHPEFAGSTVELKHSFFAYLDQINPHITRIDPAIGSPASGAFKWEAERPILVPDPQRMNAGRKEPARPDKERRR